MIRNYKGRQLIVTVKMATDASKDMRKTLDLIAKVHPNPEHLGDLHVWLGLIIKRNSGSRPWDFQGEGPHTLHLGFIKTNQSLIYSKQAGALFLHSRGEQKLWRLRYRHESGWNADQIPERYADFDDAQAYVHAISRG